MINNIPTYFKAESTLPDYRLIATMLSGCGFAFGELVLALEAYYLRTWYYLSLKLHLVSYTPKAKINFFGFFSSGGGPIIL